MLIPWPGKPENISNRHATKNLPAAGLMLTEAVVVNVARIYPVSTSLQMLTRILQSTTTGTATTAERFPLALFKILPGLVFIVWVHNYKKKAPDTAGGQS